MQGDSCTRIGYRLISGLICYFVGLRNFVMENKEHFLALERSVQPTNG